MNNRTRPVLPKGLLLFFASLLPGFSVFALGPAAYRAAFAVNYAEAETYAAEIKPLLLEALDDPLLTDVGVAVVFPELTRYSYIRDVMETAALELSYILQGDADFSIGKMQIKPSFAEQIETDADAYCRIRYPELFVKGRDEQKTRGLRILRLKNIRRQTEYLAVFLRLMVQRFPGMKGDPQRMVRIFSAAYNSGYQKSLAELEANSHASYFPYGKMGKGEQYCYSEIALDYYKQREGS